MAAAAARGTRHARARRSNGVYGRAALLRGGAQELGMRPIVGAEVRAGRRRAAAVLLLVEDRRGYQNLCRLITRAWRRARARSEGRPRRTRCSPSTPRGSIALARRGGARRSAGARRRPSARRTSSSRCSATSTPTRRTARAPPWRRRPSRASALVATNDVRYATPAQERVCTTCSPARAHRATVDEIGRRLPPNAERWLKSPAEMAALFRDLPGRRARDARHRRALRLHARRSRLHLPELSGARRARPSRATSRS